MKRMIGLVTVGFGVFAFAAPDYSNSKVHTGPAAGQVFAQPFQVVEAQLRSLGYDSVKSNGKVDKAQKYHLELKGDQEFISQRSFMFAFTTDPGKSLRGLVLKNRPLKFGTDAYRSHYYPRKDSMVARGWLSVHIMDRNSKQGDQIVNDGFSGRIEFGTPQGNFVPGQVVFVAPDGRSYVTGKFKAKIIDR
jgi:hypothetical protein